MSAINNLKGTIVYDGKVVYEEDLNNGLFFCIIVKYEDKYRGKNIENYRNSSHLCVETCVTDKKTISYSNGVKSLVDSWDEAKIKVLDDFKTKDEYQIKTERIKKGNYTEIKYIVEVPKKDLLLFALNNL